MQYDFVIPLGRGCCVISVLQTTNHSRGLRICFVQRAIIALHCLLILLKPLLNLTRLLNNSIHLPASRDGTHMDRHPARDRKVAAGFAHGKVTLTSGDGDRRPRTPDIGIARDDSGKAAGLVSIPASRARQAATC